MKTFEVHGATGFSTIQVGESLQNIKMYLPTDKVVIITDTNVLHFYQDQFPPYDVISIASGEHIKNLDTVRYLYEKLVDLEADRSTFILGIGGGVVCDIAGFVASTYLRGVRFGFVSTTLLAQVDASVGGKNGVNLKGYKNIIGVFKQPEFVLCDLNLLQTLPEKEVLCGFAEIVKHAVIGDIDLFTYLEERYANALALDIEIMERLVYDSIKLKSSIVNRDEQETGERRKLNFGHTFGHAIEKTTGVSHGEAVSVGMVMASDLSVRRGNLTHPKAERIKTLLTRLKLPTRLDINKTQMVDALRKDKKRHGDRVYFILLDDVGLAVVEEITLKELEAALDEWF